MEELNKEANLHREIISKMAVDAIADEKKHKSSKLELMSIIDEFNSRNKEMDLNIRRLESISKQHDNEINKLIIENKQQNSQIEALITSNDLLMRSHKLFSKISLRKLIYEARKKIIKDCDPNNTNDLDNADVFNAIFFNIDTIRYEHLLTDGTISLLRRSLQQYNSIAHDVTSLTDTELIADAVISLNVDRKQWFDLYLYVFGESPEDVSFNNL